MDRQKGIAPILIIILIALAVGGYLLYQKQTKPAVSQPSPSPVATPVASSSAETVNWKTYTNTKVGFQIKYPPRYSKPGLPSGAPTVPALYADGNEESGTILFGNPSGINEDGFILHFYSFTGTLDKLSLDMSYGQPYDFSGENNNYGEDNVLITRKELLIDGKPALSLTKKYIDKITGSEVGSPYMGIFFINWGYGFGIIADREYDIQEVNQILATFKFLDQNQVETKLSKKEITGICDTEVKYKSNTQVQNNVSAQKAFQNFVNYMKANKLKDDNLAVDWEFNKAEYAGIYQDASYWLITFVYFLGSGEKGNAQVHVNQSGNIVKLLNCI